MRALTSAREHVKIILVNKLPLLSYAIFRIKPPLQFHPMEETMFLSFSCSCHYRFVMKEFGRVLTPRIFNELGAGVHFNFNILILLLSSSNNEEDRNRDFLKNLFCLKI